MPRVKSSAAIALATLWLCLGCSYQPTIHIETPEQSEISPATLQELQGRWKIVANVWSDCPQAWKRSLPLGETDWKVHDNKLTIRPIAEPSNIAELWRIDEKTFERSTSVDALGCEATETLTLVIDQKKSRWSRGVFSAQMSHNGSAVCLNFAQDDALPQRCETIVEWQAQRL